MQQGYATLNHRAPNRMNRLRGFLLAGVAMFAPAASCLAQADGGETFNLSFTDARLVEVTQLISSVLDREIEPLDPPYRMLRVTHEPSGPLNREGLWQLYLNLLAGHGLTATESTTESESIWRVEPLPVTLADD